MSAKKGTESQSDNKDARFSPARLHDIFRISSAYPQHLISRESSHLEFKKTFHFLSLPDYARTMAAYANAQGGYIVYGVSNHPRRLVGLNSNDFDNIDPEKITRGLNDIFAPELEWQSTVYEIGGNKFGLLYTAPCGRKPVIATKNAGKYIKEGEIYYRYRGRTQTIRYPELRAIIEQLRDHENRLWLSHISNIARIGVQDAAVLDLTKGEAKGLGGTLVIDKALLPELRFIREGSFNEKKGSPVIKIVGEAKVMGEVSFLPSKRVYVPKGIRLPDIIHAFLTREKVHDAHEYLKAICFEATSFLPVYFFIVRANMNLSTACELIQSVQSRSVSRDRLLQRLKANEQFSLKIPKTGSPAYAAKERYRSQILNQSLAVPERSKDIRYALQAIRSTGSTEINADYLFPILRDWFDRYYFTKAINIADDFRRALCHLDYSLHQQNCKW